MDENRYIIPFTVTNPTTAPFLQIATPATCGLVLVEFVLGQEASETSEQAVVQFQRRTTASTLPTAATISPINDPAVTTRLASSTTTNAYGIASATGTAGALLDQYCFNVLTGLLVVPVPLALVGMGVSQFLTVQFKTAPAANVYTGHAKLVEE
jgi:hypothetical protein